MLREGAALPSDQPGLFAALLIALAGGWAASRILRSPADPFHALAVGVGGAVLGLTAAGVLQLRLNGVGLLIAAMVGGLVVLSAWRAIARKRERNHAARDEFEDGNKLEDHS
jgi:uncharacterized membrane protein YeaQ/YmgE (transglycosylase-associated protein family)